MTRPWSAGNPTGTCLDALDPNGLVLEAVEGVGVGLKASTVYYFPLPYAKGYSLSAVQLSWDAAIVITAAQIESTLYPRKKLDGSDLVTDVVETAGLWVPEDPATAYVGFDPKTGAGNSVVGATIAHTAGAAGGCIWHLGNHGAPRARLMVSVGAGAGVVLVATAGKIP